MSDLLIQASEPNPFGAVRPRSKNPKSQSFCDLLSEFSPLCSHILCPRKPTLLKEMLHISRRIRQRPSLSILSPRHRALSTSRFLASRNHTTEVPVASYTGSEKSGPGAAERTTLKVDGSASSSSSSSHPVSSEDVGRKAVVFDRSVVAKMTPTMKRFTLEGKVAVVTG